MRRTPPGKRLRCSAGQSRSHEQRHFSRRAGRPSFGCLRQNIEPLAAEGGRRYRPAIAESIVFLRPARRFGLNHSTPVHQERLQQRMRPALWRWIHPVHTIHPERFRPSTIAPNIWPRANSRVRELCLQSCRYRVKIYDLHACPQRDQRRVVIVNVTVVPVAGIQYERSNRSVRAISKTLHGSFQQGRYIRNIRRLTSKRPQSSLVFVALTKKYVV